MLSQSSADNITVTGKKIHSFLRGKVCERKRKNNDSNIIGYSTLRQYGTAYIELYKQQKPLNRNANPHQQVYPGIECPFQFCEVR